MANVSIPCDTANDFVETVLNVFEAVDVIELIKGGQYDDLSLNVGQALLKRADVRKLTSRTFSR